ncbi:MAG: cytochrome-c peroxidase [Gemmataceae bacterium]
MRFLLPLALFAAGAAAGNPPDPVPARDPYDAAVPNETLMTPEKDTVPVRFVTRNSNPAVWDKLPGFWTEGAEEFADPLTGAKTARRVVTIKVPLGLSQAPVSPAENPLTLAKWELGKRLYFDKTLSSNGTVSCATCHDPAKGWSDKSKTSLGINEQLGGMNAPTVINSAYHTLQFWDGRAASLEEQAQGPVGNPLEMFAGKGEPWEEAVARLRRNPEYVRRSSRCSATCRPGTRRPRRSPRSSGPCSAGTVCTTAPRWPCGSGRPRRRSGRRSLPPTTRQC